MADVVLEEEEWDAQEGLSMMEDGVYFVEDLTERKHPSIQGVALEEFREEENEEEEEWDAEGGSFIEDLEKSREENDKEEEWNAEGGFFMEDLEESREEENDDDEECDIENGFSTDVRNLEPMHELPVFGYDSDDGDLEDHEDKPKKSKYNGDGDGALVLQDDPSMKVMEKNCMDQHRVKEPQRSQQEVKKHEVWRTKLPDLRYVRGSLSQVSSYMEIAKENSKRSSLDKDKEEN
ncbi:hypothetical protein BRADI_2g48414v3 [Brachypodium distachyon]|uniref:Uncharacterized protein n=1 Tax=Brachypodium distachyon TaxID=15368 RepID=A0A2K2DEP7_BRADI|nr:hypothetical protein BRADI_2g48414v3 [Brachypodium distachyon]